MVLSLTPNTKTAYDYMGMRETMRLRVAGFLGVGPGLVEVSILDILQHSTLQAVQCPKGPLGPYRAFAQGTLPGLLGGYSVEFAVSEPGFAFSRTDALHLAVL